jgi:hypothetical protein
MTTLAANQQRGWNISSEKSRLVIPRADSTDSLTARLSLQEKTAESDKDWATDPLVQGLVDRLPKPDSIWSLDERAQWLRTAASIFGLVYKASDGERGEIGVVLTEREATDSLETETKKATP